ncbi:MAG: molybdate ABC transporter substrate-binding protein [Acidimicrobiia bacterium]|nr:molybdate ABC transporter substrate-binding protein [Acidimicrobiia bacterium]
MNRYHRPRVSRRPQWWWGLLVVAAVLPAGCARTTGASTLVVSAAASLAAPFGAITAAFEDLHPDVDVALNLAGSTSLREQILGGAPVDVFASADWETMDDVVGVVRPAGVPAVFARTDMVVAVPVANSAGVTGIGALADPALFVGLCAVPVPCGVYARQVLSAAGVEPSIDTAEPDVRSLVDKLVSGELDVGLVYATDVVATPGLTGIEVPPGTGVTVEYPIVSLDDGAIASAFVAFVRSDVGQDILRAHGFDTP